MRPVILILFALGSSLAAAVDSGTNKIPSAVPESFELVPYRPIATQVQGLRKNAIPLDGAWRIDQKPDQDVREKPLNAPSWRNFHVPGQWAQQGYDIPRDKTAALAKEFSIPAEWGGYRIFLRFYAIHGGTHCWLNGKPLSETYIPEAYRDTRSYAEFIVPEDSYFVMGDHRSISSDSREFGPVERSLIYGKAVFVYWPARDAGVVR